jgi:hypothetical protein
MTINRCDRDLLGAMEVVIAAQLYEFTDYI